MYCQHPLKGTRKSTHGSVFTQLSATCARGLKVSPRLSSEPRFLVILHAHCPPLTHTHTLHTPPPRHCLFIYVNLSQRGPAVASHRVPFRFLKPVIFNTSAQLRSGQAGRPLAATLALGPGVLQGVLSCELSAALVARDASVSPLLSQQPMGCPQDFERFGGVTMKGAGGLAALILWCCSQSDNQLLFLR